MKLNKKVRCLFVCMGNICRSPTAQAVVEHLVESKGLSDMIYADSAGTHDYHIGEQPDKRSQRTALKRNIDMSSQQARRVEAEDFDIFDYVLAMDKDNYIDLEKVVTSEQGEERLHLFMSFAEQRAEMEVPDPYYGGTHGFERVFDMVQEASEGLLADILKKHRSI